MSQDIQSPERPLREAIEKLRRMICLPAHVEHMLDEALSQCPVFEVAGYEGASGLYQTRLQAVNNFEQKSEPVYRVKP